MSRSSKVPKTYGQATGRDDARRAKIRQRKAVPVGSVSAEDLDAETILRCIYHVTNSGGAIRFGHTRDHGAWAIGVYGDGAEAYTEYVRPGEDGNEYFRKLGNFFAGIEDEVP
jgi:hypothetical protein